MNYLFLILSLVSADDDFAISARNGINAMKAERYNEAINYFEQTLSTHPYQIHMSKAAIYWDLYNLYLRTNQYELSGNALIGVIENVKYMLVDNNELSKALDEKYNISEQFELATLILETYWIRSNPQYCKYIDRPCVIKNMSVIPLFAEYVPFCLNDTIVKQTLSKTTNTMFLIQVDCEEIKDETYFFDVEK